MAPQASPASRTIAVSSPSAGPSHRRHDQSPSVPSMLCDITNRGYHCLSKPLQCTILTLDLAMLMLCPVYAWLWSSRLSQSYTVMGSDAIDELVLDQFCGALQGIVLVQYVVTLLLLVWHYTLHSLIVQCVLSSLLFISLSVSLSTTFLAENCWPGMNNSAYYSLAACCLLLVRVFFHLTYCLHLVIEQSLALYRQHRRQLRSRSGDDGRHDSQEPMPYEHESLSALFPRSSTSSLRVRIGLNVELSQIPELTLTSHPSSTSGDATVSDQCDDGAEGIQRPVCAICLDRFEAGELLCVTRCSHRYHAACLTGWISVNASCPECRTSILRTEPAPTAHSPRHQLAFGSYQA